MRAHYEWFCAGEEVKREKILRLVLCSSAFGWLAFAYGFASQKTSQSSPPPGAESERSAQRESFPPESVEVQTLIANAMDAPPEFSADALLRIARSSRISPKTRRELIEYAFSVADRAQHPVQLGTAGRVASDQEGFLTYAYALQLDSLSLRCRAVKAMLQVNNGRAREMFFSISLPELPPLSCDDRLVYDVSAFYGALSAVLNNAFTEKEIERGDAVYLVDRYIDEMVSPVQLEPLAKTISEIKTSLPQLRLLVFNLSRRLQQIQDDDRAFSAGNKSLVERSLGGLLNVCKRRGVQADDLVEALRAYIVKHHKSKRCSDTVADLLKERPTLPRYIDTFNNITRLLGSTERKEIPPITLKEITPKEVKAVPASTPFFQSLKSRKLLERLRQLRFGHGTQELSAEEKSEQAWRDNVLEFLNEVNDWSGDDEAKASVYFHEKAILFMNLVATVPPGPLYFRILDSYIGFLSDSSFLTKGDGIERLFYIDLLLRMGRALRGEESEKFERAIRSSRDVVLHLYATLDDIGPDDESGTNRRP